MPSSQVASNLLEVAVLQQVTKSNFGKCVIKKTNHIAVDTYPPLFYANLKDT